jgi:hypothetical protein
VGSLTGISAGAQSSGLPFLILGKTSSPEFRPALNDAVKGNLQNTLLQAIQGNKAGNKSDAQQNQKPDLQGVLGGLLNKKKKPQ